MFSDVNDSLNDKMARLIDRIYMERRDDSGDYTAEHTNSVLINVLDEVKDSLEEVYGDI